MAGASKLTSIQLGAEEFSTVAAASRGGAKKKGSRRANSDDSMVMPHDPEMERAVLGTISMDGPVGLRQCSGLQAEHFFLDSHRRIFTALTTLVAEDVTEPGITLLADRLRQSGELERVNGVAYLASLSEGLPRMMDIGHYATRLIELWKQRQSIDAGERFLKALYGHEPAAEAHARLQRELSQLVSRRVAAPSAAVSTAVITSVEAFIRRFLVLPTAAYLPVATWFVATHVAESFGVFPYLNLTSPEKRCGKTRGLELGQLLCAKAVVDIFPSPSALFRMMEDCPTVLLDEVDQILKSKGPLSETQQSLVGILNAGYKRGATVPRSAPNGNGKFKLERYPVYGPKAFASIGSLPGTITDRSIVVRMQRKSRKQKLERFLLPRVEPEAAALRTSIEGWAENNRALVEDAYKEMADLDYLSDRDAEIWMPLFAVCAVCEPERVPDLKKAALTLCGAKAGDAEESSTSLRLLRDVRDVWPSGDRILTVDLLERLRELPESPWVEYDLKDWRLAKLVSGYEIRPQTIRLHQPVRVKVKGEDKDMDRGKGYYRSEFESAWDIYFSSSLPSSPI
jgi:hypothetical protein